MRLGAKFCPGILHAVPARDGLLMRIRIPGGLITASQLKTIADVSEEFADGTIEITSRSNLQVRAICEQNVAEIARRLDATGLLPSPLHERVRNIATSPFAGIDIEETIDTRPLIHQLDQSLIADTVFADLHPKFNFGIYGGSRRFSQEGDDLALEAMDANGDLLFRLLIDGVDSGFATNGDGPADCLLNAGKLFLSLAKEHGCPVRARQVMAIPAALQQVKEFLSHTLRPCPPVAQAESFVEEIPGILPALVRGRVNIIPSVSLGRLTVGQSRYIADAVKHMEADLRLAPWRGIVLGSVQKDAAENIVKGLRTVGLHCDGRDGFQGIAACAGITGCDGAFADVRGDAALLARSLEGTPAPAGWTVNFSGCEKQCGRRHGATADLIAYASGYTVRLEGQEAVPNCSSQFALHAVTALHAELLSEVVSR